ncbi:MAG TPA: type II toxin-antitoxin system prevent-host-death family antitoxin [Terracidiphilus sp.]|nr:type II toxin-antitoxin system prevent-host-death family antitoxin [Terracidiphilus sp.]
MRTINIHQAKTHLSRLVDEAEKGDSFIIAKAGKPKVKVVRLDAPKVPGKRRLGSLEGMYTIPDNFEEIDRELDQEVEKLMFGEDDE